MKLLQAIRTEQGMSVSALARRAGVSRQTIAKIENGTGNPTSGSMEKLAMALGCPTRELLSGARGTAAWSFRDRSVHLQNITEIVQLVGRDLSNYKKRVEDTCDMEGRAGSTLLAFAQAILVTAFTEVYGRSSLGHDWSMQLHFDDVTTTLTGRGSFFSDAQYPHCSVAYIKAIDGVDNLKRAVAGAAAGNPMAARPQATIGIALCHDRQSTAVEAAAVYAFDEDVTYGGILAEGGYATFRNERRIDVGTCDYSRGDSRQRIVVPCYSNNGYGACAKLQEAITHYSGGSCVCYGGCRSSILDVINILRNQYDAYVDCRELWTTDLRCNSVLRMQDIVAVLPIARGADLSVVTLEGDNYSLESAAVQDPVSVIIGRPQQVSEVVAAIAPLVEKLRHGSDSRQTRSNSRNDLTTTMGKPR